MPPFRDIVVGFAFYIGLRGPGRVPGFSPFLHAVLLRYGVRYPRSLSVYEDRIQSYNTEKIPAWPSGLCIRRGELSEGSGSTQVDPLNSWGFQATHRGVKVFVLATVATLGNK